MNISHKTTPNDHLKIKTDKDRFFSYRIQINLHVAFLGEKTVQNSFDGHPSERKTSYGLLTICAVFVNGSRQSEVGNFDEIVVADEHVSTGQVAMN